MKPAVTAGSAHSALTENRLPSPDAVSTLFIPRAPAHRRSHAWQRQSGLPLHALRDHVAGAIASRPGIRPTTRRSRPTRTDPSTAIQLDQYYTRPAVAMRCYRIVRRHYDTSAFLLVEPSAGTGAFARLLPAGSLAFDLEPKHHLVQKADFFKVAIPRGQPVMVIGNPPFGRASRVAVAFFNHAARFASVIAMILPRTVRKAGTENKLDRSFHLVMEQIVPRNAFEFQGMEHDVPTVFQIWERRAEPRPLRPVEMAHRDFRFVTPADADFAIRRIGVNAGMVHRDLTASPSSHYFIKGDVEAAMRELDLAGAAADTAAIPSLAKNEIVALYRQDVEGRSVPIASLLGRTAGRSAGAARRPPLPAGTQATPEVRDDGPVPSACRGRRPRLADRRRHPVPGGVSRRDPRRKRAVILAALMYLELPDQNVAAGRHLLPQGRLHGAAAVEGGIDLQPVGSDRQRRKDDEFGRGRGLDHEPRQTDQVAPRLVGDGGLAENDRPTPTFTSEVANSPVSRFTASQTTQALPTTVPRRRSPGAVIWASAMRDATKPTKMPTHALQAARRRLARSTGLTAPSPRPAETTSGRWRAGSSPPASSPPA